MRSDGTRHFLFEEFFKRIIRQIYLEITKLKKKQGEPKVEDSSWDRVCFRNNKTRFYLKPVPCQARFTYIRFHSVRFQSFPISVKRSFSFYSVPNRNRRAPNIPSTRAGSIGFLLGSNTCPGNRNLSTHAHTLGSVSV